LNHALILCRSVTQAQRVSRGLAAVGISNRILRSPIGLTQRGCSYSVKISGRNLTASVQILRQLNLQPLRFFLSGSDGTYTEVTGE